MNPITKLRHRLEMRRLLRELGNKGAKSPELAYSIRVPKDNAYYDFVKHKIVLPPDIDRKIEEATLAHELAHATGITGTRGNELTKTLMCASNVIANSPVIDGAVQMAGGVPVSVAAHLARLAEEGQANVRGHKALKKVKKGKLTDEEKASFIKSMGSYAITLPVGAVVPPKVLQMGLDIAHPGFAENHKVLYDYIADAC